MATQSQLVGYVRKSRGGGALNLSIDAAAFSKAERFTGSDGREFVSLIVNLDKVQDIIEGEREVTSLCQLIDGE
ncbi:MAG: hypothetical protein AYK23_01420 [Candidatus Proteinoplasmatales archaeon SG8-5]|nr:MAG: hypothetical protein AYK23_01420 [Candidatus Proteinoplasmatales archaeon SG8-5]